MAASGWFTSGASDAVSSPMGVRRVTCASAFCASLRASDARFWSSLAASGHRVLELRVPVTDDAMEVDLASRQIPVPRLQDLDAPVGHVLVEAGNRPLQRLPDPVLGQGLGDDPRTELAGFEAGLEEWD